MDSYIIIDFIFIATKKFNLESNVISFLPQMLWDLAMLIKNSKYNPLNQFLYNYYCAWHTIYN